MAAPTPSERSAIASIAANTRWANEDNRAAATAKARDNSPASLTYWMRKVDPDGVLPRATRVAKAENARKAHYKAIMRKARAAKAAKRAGAA